MVFVAQINRHSPFDAIRGGKDNAWNGVERQAAGGSSKDWGLWKLDSIKLACGVLSSHSFVAYLVWNRCLEDISATEIAVGFGEP